MPHDARRTSLPREALTRARPHSGQCIPHEARAQSTDFFHHYSRWLPSWRALRRGARLLLRQRAAAHAPRPQSKHSLLTPFTTTRAGPSAGARCDAARGCCGGGGRRAPPAAPYGHAFVTGARPETIRHMQQSRTPCCTPLARRASTAPEPSPTRPRRVAAAVDAARGHRGGATKDDGTQA